MSHFTPHQSAHFCSMDFINICMQLTGVFPAKSVGFFKKVYEWTWNAFLIFIPAMTLYSVSKIRSFRLADIVSAVQGPSLALRLSFSILFFSLRKQRYIQILEEKRELTKWMKMLAFQSDFAASRINSKTCIAVMLFYIPNVISLLSLLFIFLTPLILFSSENLPTNYESNRNSTEIDQQNIRQTSVLAIKSLILPGILFLTIFISELKRRCVNFLIFKMYLDVIKETHFLIEALTATFTERRAFFQKVNLSNWLKCKERLIR
jgi:hypothetical protein